MDKVWRLMTAMFSIVTACGLFALASMLSGGRLNDLFSEIVTYVCLLCIPFGIIKGILVIVDYHREHKGQEEE